MLATSRSWRARTARSPRPIQVIAGCAGANGMPDRALCRRVDFVAFRDSFGATSAPAMDATLHAERTGARPSVDLDALPDGAMVAIDGAAWLVAGGSLLRWTDGGYTDVAARPSRRVTLLTAPSTVDAIRRGYTPAWRPPPRS